MKNPVDKQCGKKKRYKPKKQRGDAECQDVVSEHFKQRGYIIMKKSFPGDPEIREGRLKRLSGADMLHREMNVPCRIVKKAVLVPRGRFKIPQMGYKEKSGEYYEKQKFGFIKREKIMGGFFVIVKRRNQQDHAGQPAHPHNIIAV